MRNELLEATKKASYLLWEFLRREEEEPLVLWNCVEDIACFFETSDILEEEDMLLRLKNDVYSHSYIEFMRNISYRVYFYTEQKAPMSNWYCAERLLSNTEWRLVMSRLAKLFRAGKHDAGFVSGIHNEKIKEYYSGFVIDNAELKENEK